MLISRISRRLVLIAVSMVAIYSTPAYSLAALVADYPLNGNTNDISGNGYNGTVSGTSTYVTGVGGMGQAFSFDSNTTIATTSTNNLGIYSATGGSFTVDMWVNFNALLGGNGDAAGGTSGTGTDMGLQLLERNGTPFFGFYGDDLQGSTALTAGTWYNLAWVYSSTGLTSGTQTMYVSTLGAGDTVTTSVDSTRTSNAFLGAGQTFNIGASCCGANMAGLIQNVQIYNTALSQSQVNGIAQIVPEPSSCVLLGVGAAGLFIAARRRRKA